MLCKALCTLESWYLLRVLDPIPHGSQEIIVLGTWASRSTRIWWLAWCPIVSGWWSLQTPRKMFINHWLPTFPCLWPLCAGLCTPTSCIVITLLCWTTSPTCPEEHYTMYCSTWIQVWRTNYRSPLWHPLYSNNHGFHLGQKGLLLFPNPSSTFFLHIHWGTRAGITKEIGIGLNFQQIVIGLCCSLNHFCEGKWKMWLPSFQGWLCGTILMRSHA